jgi:hypothetical protein
MKVWVAKQNNNIIAICNNSKKANDIIFEIISDYIVEEADSPFGCDDQLFSTLQDHNVEKTIEFWNKYGPRIALNYQNFIVEEYDIIE